MTNITKFFHQFSSKTYKKGQVVLEPNSLLDSMFYIDSGQVKMYSISDSGQEINLHVFRTTSYFPIMLVLTNSSNKYYFEAESSSKLYKAPTEKVLEFLKSNPDEQLDLLQKFSFGLVGLLNRVENLTSLPTSKQIDSLLTHLNSKSKTSKIRHQDIANWLGVSRETVSRLHKSKN